MGEVISSTGRKISVAQYEKYYLEEHVRHSNALHSHTKEGKKYMVGPLARLNLNHEQLGSKAQVLADGTENEMPIRNPFKALFARSLGIGRGLRRGDPIDKRV